MDADNPTQRVNFARRNTVEGLRIYGNGAYIDAYFQDYPGATCTVAATAAGCVSGRPFLNGQPFNGAGLPLQLLSKWTGTIGFDYNAPISDTLELQMSGSADMFSEYYFDSSSYSADFGLQPGEAILNFRLGIAEMDGGWSLAFVGENLTDVWRGGQAFTYPGFPGTARVYGIYGGRNLMIQGSLKF